MLCEGFCVRLKEFKTEAPSGWAHLTWCVLSRRSGEKGCPDDVSRRGTFMKRKVNVSRASGGFASLRQVRLAAAACSVALAFSVVVPVASHNSAAVAGAAEDDSLACEEENANELRRSIPITRMETYFDDWLDDNKTKAKFFVLAQF